MSCFSLVLYSFVLSITPLRSIILSFMRAYPVVCLSLEEVWVSAAELQIEIWLLGQRRCGHRWQISCSGEWSEKWETRWSHLTLSEVLSLLLNLWDSLLLVFISLILRRICALIDELVQTLTSFLKLELVGEAACLGLDQNKIRTSFWSQLLYGQRLDQTSLLFGDDGRCDGRVLLVGLLLGRLGVLLLGVNHWWDAVVHFFAFGFEWARIAERKICCGLTVSMWQSIDRLLD